MFSIHSQGWQADELNTLVLFHVVFDPLAGELIYVVVMFQQQQGSQCQGIGVSQVSTRIHLRNLIGQSKVYEKIKHLMIILNFFFFGTWDARPVICHLATTPALNNFLKKMQLTKID